MSDRFRRRRRDIALLFAGVIAGVAAASVYDILRSYLTPLVIAVSAILVAIVIIILVGMVGRVAWKK